MPSRKAKTAPKRAREHDSVSESVTSDIGTSSTASKKRKIDWANIDNHTTFEGFTLQPARIKTNQKQKSRKSADGKSVSSDAGYKQDAPLGADIVQKDPFADNLLSETHYVVKPSAEWESTLRYRKFTISDAEFEVGQTIFVSKTEEEQDAHSTIQHWVGKVLEVRAGDASHVYLRVYWLYRPEDLPGGRQPHHAESELIASNHMDIIEALSVIDKASVMHWDEDMEKPWPLKDQLFWRQTIDVAKPKNKQLSKLRTICVDKAPCNPDEGVLQCSSCSEWLHPHCLENQAVKDAQAKSQGSNKEKGSRKSSANTADITAHLTLLGDSAPTYLTVTNHKSTDDEPRFNVDITCLLCNALIEEAADHFPPEKVPFEHISQKAAHKKLDDGDDDGNEDSVIGTDEDTTTTPPSENIQPGETTAAPIKTVDD